MTDVFSNIASDTRVRESNERNEMGEEDALSKVVDDEKRARDRKSFAELDSEYLGLAKLVMKSISQRYNTNVKFAELLKKFKAINQSELTLLLSKTPKDKDKRQQLKNEKNEKIFQSIIPAFKYIVDNPDDEGDALNYLHDLCVAGDFY